MSREYKENRDANTRTGADSRVGTWAGATPVLGRLALAQNPLGTIASLGGRSRPRFPS